MNMIRLNSKQNRMTRNGSGHLGNRMQVTLDITLCKLSANIANRIGIQ